MTLAEKRELLGSILRGYGRVAVAFSGGCDSSLLCAAARDELGDAAIAITVVSPLLPASELEDAKAVARSLGIEHLLVEEGGIDEAVAANPPDRCYHCKKIEFAALARAARSRGFATLLDGSNLDDEGDYRPGMRALAELGVSSPLKQAGLRKAEIRELARLRGLATWDKPAAACLASRFPYGERLDAAGLSMVEAAESFLRGLGLGQLRVRCHGGRLARIEVPPHDIKKLCEIETMGAVAARLKELGFLYVCADLEGYSMGSLNRALGPAKEG